MIQLPFIFTYMYAGKRMELVITTMDGWIPLKPIVEAMHMKWDVQREVLRLRSDVQLISLPGGRGRPPLCITRQGLKDYVIGLNANRVRSPDLVRVFQDLLPTTLDQYFESLESEPNPELEEPEQEQLEQEAPEQIKKMDAATAALMDYQLRQMRNSLWSAEQVEAYLKSNTIVINRPFNGVDFVRKDLVTVGVRDPKEINYLLSGIAVKLFKYNPDGEPFTKQLMFSAYESGQLLEMAKQGYYPLPEYYRRFPEVYVQQVETYLSGGNLKSTKTLKAGKGDEYKQKTFNELKTVVRPLAQAPWNTDEFARKIEERKSLVKMIEERELNEQIQKLVESGGNLFDILWSNGET